MPSAKDVFEYRRGFARLLDLPFGRQEVTINIGSAAALYKKLAFVTFFNAGVRAIDVRDPYAPKEVGYFIPAITEATDKRCIRVDGQPKCKTAIQTNNAETDDRGYIYIVDRANTGMHVLELTGEPRAIAGMRPQ